LNGLLRTRSGLVLLALSLAAGLTASVLYYEYEAQVSTNLQREQLVNGVPITTVDSCASTNFSSGHPGNSDFQGKLPKNVENAAIGGFDLVTYWPDRTSNTGFVLYEVWNVTLIISNQPLTFLYMDMMYTINCTL
jgi:hypothetical protein